MSSSGSHHTYCPKENPNKHPGSYGFLFEPRASTAEEMAIWFSIAAPETASHLINEGPLHGLDLVIPGGYPERHLGGAGNWCSGCLPRWLGVPVLGIWGVSLEVAGGCWWYFQRLKTFTTLQHEPRWTSVNCLPVLHASKHHPQASTGN